MNEDTSTTDTAHIPVVQQLLVLVAIILLIFGTGYAPKLLAMLQAPAPPAVATVLTPAIEPEPIVTAEAIDYFADISLVGEAAFVWDITAKRALYQKNPDEQLPLASITKLMTALVAHELLEKDSSVPVTLSAIRQDGASGLADGESFDIQDLTDLTLISSSNDGAYALASAAGALLLDSGNADTFVQAMNIRAAELGLTQTNFKNPTGLDVNETEVGAVGSARDMAFLLEYLLLEAPAVIEATANPTTIVYNENGAYHDAENTNAAINEIAGLLASKTGYTELAGGNLAIAFDASVNRPIIAVVLGSTRTARFEDIITLANAARAVAK